MATATGGGSTAKHSTLDSVDFSERGDVLQPFAPDDVLRIGLGNQVVEVIPSLDMVIVRMGVAPQENLLYWLTDLAAILREMKNDGAHIVLDGVVRRVPRKRTTDEPLTEDVMIALIAALAALWTLLSSKLSRPDGDLIAKVHPYRRLMAFVMRSRTESTVYLDAEPARREIARVSRAPPPSRHHLDAPARRRCGRCAQSTPKPEPVRCGKASIPAAGASHHLLDEARQARRSVQGRRGQA